MTISGGRCVVMASRTVRPGNLGKHAESRKKDNWGNEKKLPTYKIVTVPTYIMYRDFFELLPWYE